MPQPIPKNLMQAVFDYAKALTDDPVIAVAVLTGDKAEDWVTVAVAKTPERSDDEVISLLVNSLIAAE